MNAITTTAATFKNVRGTDRTGAERQLDSPSKSPRQQQQQHVASSSSFSFCSSASAGQRRSTQIESRLYWYQDLAWLLQA